MTEQQEGQVELVSEAEANANEVAAIETNTGAVMAVGNPTPVEESEEDNGNEAIAVEEVQAGDAVAEEVAADQEA